MRQTGAGNDLAGDAPLAVECEGHAEFETMFEQPFIMAPGHKIAGVAVNVTPLCTTLQCAHST